MTPLVIAPVHDWHRVSKDDFGARYITLRGSWDIEVLQEDGHWPPSAVVQASRTAPRDPLTFDPQTVAKTRFMAPLTPHVYDRAGNLTVYIYCGSCGDWQHPDAFSDDGTRPNGKRGWCKSCCADRQRNYRAAKRLAKAA